MMLWLLQYLPNQVIMMHGNERMERPNPPPAHFILGLLNVFRPPPLGGLVRPYFMDIAPKPVCWQPWYVPYRPPFAVEAQDGAWNVQPEENYYEKRHSKRQGQERHVVDFSPPRLMRSAYKMALIYMFGAVLLLVLLWRVFRFLLGVYRTWRTLRPIPTRPGHWFWGHLMQIRPDEKTLLQLTEFYSYTGYKFTLGWLGPIHPVIVLNHYDPIRKVLKEPKNHDTYRLLVPWLGDGLLVSEGHKWYRNRHLLTPAFHFEILKPYVTVYNNCLQVLLSKWSAAADRKEPVKLFDTISLLSLDIILQCAFSYKSDCQNVSTRHPYIKAVYELIDLLADRFFTPLYVFDWIYILTPDGWRNRKNCKIVHEHSEKVIQKRRKSLNQPKDSKGDAPPSEATTQQQRYLDFLDVLLTAVDEDGNGLTDLEIRNEADTFMFEGHDTTTSGISWTLYCLAQYPEHQEKVREEVRNVLMGREWLEYDDLKELKYTQWVIKEAMRLYPPVFLIFRETSEDIELNGYNIPKGVPIFIPIIALHHNQHFWENPEKFDPLRFHPSNVEGRDPLAYMPFSAGPRNCIGQNFAMNEERVVVASIVHRFRLSLVEDHRVEIVPKVVLRTKDDIKVNLEPLA